MRWPRVGPGALVAAAFIGPGTVTTCILAGVRFGDALLWALLFATLATIILQEMSARIGTVAGLGLGEALRSRLRTPGLRLGAAILITAAIGFGNAAFQTGNLLGAALGAELLLGGSLRGWALAVALVAAVLLWRGNYRIIERALVGLVILMSGVFVLTALRTGAFSLQTLAPLLTPSLPEGSTLVALGLIGTTVVPYNLFLHASAARERFHRQGTLTDARVDLVIAIGAGGLVSMAILLTGARGGGADITSAADMARHLEPLLGRWARGFFALGLLAAGLTSAITAPLAAAWAVAGACGWEGGLRSPRFRMVWGTVLMTGALFAASGVRPVPAILFAQAANGLLLPVIALFLLATANDRTLLGDARNGVLANLFGTAIVLVTVALGLRGLLGAFGIL